MPNRLSHGCCCGDCETWLAAFCAYQKRPDQAICITTNTVTNATAYTTLTAYSIGDRISHDDDSDGIDSFWVVHIAIGSGENTSFAAIVDRLTYHFDAESSSTDSLSASYLTLPSPWTGTRKSKTALLIDTSGVDVSSAGLIAYFAATHALLHATNRRFRIRSIREQSTLPTSDSEYETNAGTSSEAFQASVTAGTRNAYIFNTLARTQLNSNVSSVVLFLDYPSSAGGMSFVDPVVSFAKSTADGLDASVAVATTFWSDHVEYVPATGSATEPAECGRLEPGDKYVFKKQIPADDYEITPRMLWTTADDPVGDWKFKARWLSNPPGGDDFRSVEYEFGGTSQVPLTDMPPTALEEDKFYYSASRIGQPSQGSTYEEYGDYPDTLKSTMAFKVVDTSPGYGYGYGYFDGDMFYINERSRPSGEWFPSVATFSLIRHFSIIVQDTVFIPISVPRSAGVPYGGPLLDGDTRPIFSTDEYAAYGLLSLTIPDGSGGEKRTFAIENTSEITIPFRSIEFARRNTEICPRRAYCSSVRQTKELIRLKASISADDGYSATFTPLMASGCGGFAGEYITSSDDPFYFEQGVILNPFPILLQTQPVYYHFFNPVTASYVIVTVGVNDPDDGNNALDVFAFINKPDPAPEDPPVRSLGCYVKITWKLDLGYPVNSIADVPLETVIDSTTADLIEIFYTNSTPSDEGVPYVPGTGMPTYHEELFPIAVTIERAGT